MTQHIGAAVIIVPDYNLGIAFYCGKLGFDLVEDTVMSPSKRWVLVAPTGAQTRILLAQASGPEQIAAVGNQTGGRVGFFLHTTNFAHDFEQMTAAGVTFEEAPRHETYGSVAVFCDPWGNRWDLLELSDKS